MSRTSIYYETICESDNQVAKRVISSDFNDSFLDQEIGILYVYRDDGWIDFIPTNIWEEKKILPLYIFRLCEKDRNFLTETKYKDTVHDLWVNRIYSYGTKLLKEEK